MTTEDISKVEDLLDDSLETLQDKKSFGKTQTQLLKECAETNGLGKSGKSILKRVMNYHHYKGANWLNGDPLLKDPDVKDKKDKVAPVFIKLLQIVEDLATIGDKDFLEPYLKALLSKGIKIDIDYGSADTKEDLKTIIEKLDSASKLQTNVDTLNTQLKEEKSTESEEIGFAPKSAFMKVLGFYEKIRDDKIDKVEDSISQNYADSLSAAQAYQFLSNQIKNAQEQSDE